MKPSRYLIILSFLTLAVNCKKNTTNRQAADPNKLIADARQYFTNAVSSTALQNEKSIGRQVHKTPVWENARVVDLPSGKGVIIPLHYDKKVTITPGLAAGRPFSLESATRLLILTGRRQPNRALVITALPDNEAGTENRKSFSGMAIVEDWSGNTIKDYKFSQGAILSRTPNSGRSTASSTKIATGSKSATTIVETCYYFTTCIGTVSDPYQSCNTEDLGCVDEYIGEDQDMLVDGSGGGGDVGGAVGYTDPNIVSGVPCKATPDLTVEDSNTKAKATNTGLFLLCNVEVTFVFDPRTKTLVPGSVKTETHGIIAGTWAQTDVTGVFTSGDEINFVIHATVTATVLGFNIPVPYTIYVQYNVVTNTVYFTNS